MLLGKVADGGPNKLKAGSKITKAYLQETERDQWLEIRLKNEDSAAQLETIAAQVSQLREDFRQRYGGEKRKLTSGDDLAPVC